MEGVPKAWGPHPLYDHLDIFTIGVTNPGCHSRVTLVPMVFWASLWKGAQLGDPLMAETSRPGFKSRRSYNLVKTYLMFGDGVVSSLEYFTADSSSHDSSSNHECFAATVYFLQTPWQGEWSFLAVRYLFRPQEDEAAWCSLADII